MEKEPKSRKGRRILIAIPVGLVLLVFLLVLTSTTVNAIASQIELSRYPAPGRLVTVDGHTMHLLVQGTGPKKVVLLSGLGIACPSMDFMPLIKELSPAYTVIAVEYFGYGWSGRTERPRTNANIVDETRQALLSAGIKPPYILMPHSISGLYSLYWMNRYPAEIEALVGLDSSVPGQLALEAKYPSYDPPYLLYMELLRHSGALRIALALMPFMAGLSDSPEFYSQDELDIRFAMACATSMDGPIRNESAAVNDNTREIQGLTVPPAIPASFVLSQSTIEMFKTDMPEFDWVKMHEEIIPDKAPGSIHQMEGSHLIYRNNAAAIRKIVDETVAREG